MGALVRDAHPYGGLRFCPPAIRLLPYQLEPALAMLRHGCTRILLGDDVGLGKTVEASLIVREMAMGDRLSRSLIVVPASLRAQWARELALLFQLPAVAADAEWLRRASLDLPADVNPWSVPGVYIASIDFVKRPEALHGLELTRWDLLVVDEAHAASAHTHRLAAVRAIAWRSRRVLLLTATPHSGNEGQFAALCSIGAFPESPPLVVFARSRSHVALPSPGHHAVVLRVRNTDRARQLDAALQAYIARLTAADGAPAADLLAIILRKRALSSPFALACSLRRRMRLLSGEPDPAQQLSLPWEEDALADDDGDAALAAPGLDDSADEQGVLRAMVAQAEAVLPEEGKVRVLLRLLRRAAEPAVIFSEYRDTAAHLCDVLVRAGHHVSALHGGMSPPERSASVDAFAAGDRLLVATDAASEGLNLHHRCRLVVHFDLPWSSSRLRQRCGRVDRIGQQRRVHEVALVDSDVDQSPVLGPLARRARKARAFAHADDRSDRTIAALLGAGDVDEQNETQVAEPALQRVRFEQEAREEMDRLATSRRLEELMAVVPHRQRAVRPVSDDEQGVLPRGSLGVVVSWSVGNVDAGKVEGGVLFLALEVGTLRLPRRRGAVRRTVAGLLSAAQPAIAHQVDATMRLRISQLAPIRHLSTTHHRQRAAEMRRALQSTAQQLVQAGLFDRRALRVRGSRGLQVEALKDWDAAFEAATRSESLSATFEVAAVLVPRRRR